MKQYPDLTPDQKRLAVAANKNRLLEYLVTGALTLHDNVLQSKVDDAIKKANDAKTPWFAAAFVQDALGAELDRMAEQAAANDKTYYPDGDERCIFGVTDVAHKPQEG